MTFPPETFAVAAILFVAAVARSALGFGDALVGMPLLAFVVSVRTATPLIALSSIVISAVVILRAWRDVHFADAWRLTLSGMCGVPLGVFLLTRVDERIVTGALGVLVVGFSLWSLWKVRPVRLETDRAAPLFGVVAGTLGGAYNTHGPPLVIYGTLRNWSPERFRATLQAYFLAVGVFVVATHAVNGSFNDEVNSLALASLPGVLVAIVLGKAINRRIRPDVFIRLVHLMLIVLGAVLVWRSLESS